LSRRARAEGSPRGASRKEAAMRGRTQFWLGSVALAVVLGLLCSGLITPLPAIGEDATGGAFANRYGMVTGLPGSTERSQTLYLIDDLNDIFYILEYSSKTYKIEVRELIDLERYATEILKKRAKRDVKEKE
jgi:hypothetical protein